MFGYVGRSYARVLRLALSSVLWWGGPEAAVDR